MADVPKVLIVILNHNSLISLGDRAINFIRSILSTDYPNIEFVVIDNASSDNSDVLIERELRELGKGRLIRLEKNLGYAGGNNYAFFRFARGAKYVAFLNNDLEVERDWLAKIIEVMERDESIAAAQPKILQLQDKRLIDSMGGMLDKIGRAYDVFHSLPDNITTEKPIEVFYARGAALVVRCDAFREAGGFDDEYFIYYEETDLCWRLRLMGYKVVTVPTSKVYHLGGGTMNKVLPRAVYLRRRNQLTTLLKNYGLPRAILYSSILVTRYLGFSIFRVLSQRDWTFANAVFSSLLWNLFNLKSIMRKRAFSQIKRKVPDSEITKVMMRLRDYDLIVRYLSKSY